MGELALDKIERTLAPEWQTEKRREKRTPRKVSKAIRVISLRPEVPYTVKV